MNKVFSCPQCKKKVDSIKGKWGLFCSSKCKEIDLAMWFNESYSVPATEVTTEELEALEQELIKKNKEDY